MRSLTILAVAVICTIFSSCKGEFIDLDKCDTAQESVAVSQSNNELTISFLVDDDYGKCDMHINDVKVFLIDKEGKRIDSALFGGISFTHYHEVYMGYDSRTWKVVVEYMEGGDLKRIPFKYKDGSWTNGGGDDPPQKTIDTLDGKYSFYLIDANGNYVQEIPVTISCTKLYKDTTGTLFNEKWTTYTIKSNSNQTYEFKRFFRKECEDESGKVKIRTHTTSGFTLSSTVTSYQFELDKTVEPIQPETRSLVFGLETYSGYQYEAHIYQ